MRPLRELLLTWENWSARNTLTRSLGQVATDEDRKTLRRALVETPEVDPLDALRDVAELVSLLSGWQWQVVYAARLNGTSWAEIGAILGIEEARAQCAFAWALDCQEEIQPGSTSSYREVL